MGFSESNIGLLRSGYLEVQNELNNLILIIIPFNEILREESPNAYEYSQYGVARRLFTIKRCIEIFFEIVEPGSKPEIAEEKRKDLNIYLHSFLLNISGGIDNLAWVWFYARGIDQLEELKKFRQKIDLFGKQFKKHLDEEIIELCREMKEWQKYLKNFRDPTAHRIPPYIIPYTVADENIRENERLERELLKEDLGPEEREKIQLQLNNLRDYELKYTHSFREQSPIVLLHPQCIADARSFITLTKLVVSCLNKNQ